MRPSPICTLLLVVAAGCGDGEEPVAQRPPNVVVVVVDTLRADRLGAYGYGRDTSPVLDRLAREGALFADVTAQCSWTLPSMVSLFQGRYVTSYRDVYLEDAPTLAEVFRGAGYRTVGVVGNGLLSTAAGFDRGFEHYDARKAPRPGGRSSAARRADELFEAARGPLLQALATEADGAAPPPLFAYLHFMDPHGPYANHDAYAAALPVAPDASGVDLSRQRTEYAAAFPDRATRPATAEIWLEMHRELARYDQEVRYADEYLGLVLELLEGAGALENTVVAVVSDHGEGLYGHRTPPGRSLPAKPGPHQYFFLEHGKVLYRELVGTPMILWGVGVPAGLRIEPSVENVDLYPSLLALAGVEPPPGLHGRSLTPALRGEELAVRSAHSAILEARSARRADGWKLILPTEHGEGRDAELYRLTDDPRELENLAEHRPEIVQELRGELDRWLEAHPTPTSLGRPKSQQTLEDMKELGYAGDEE